LPKFKKQVEILLKHTGGFKEKTLDRIVLHKLQSIFGSRESKEFLDKGEVELPSQILKKKTVAKHPLFSFDPEWLNDVTKPKSASEPGDVIPWHEVVVSRLLRRFARYPYGNFGTCNDLEDMVVHAVKMKKAELGMVLPEGKKFIFDDELDQLEHYYMEFVSQNILRKLGIKKEFIVPFKECVKKDISTYEN